MTARTNRELQVSEELASGVPLQRRIVSFSRRLGDSNRIILPTHAAITAAVRPGSPHHYPAAHYPAAKWEQP